MNTDLPLAELNHYPSLDLLEDAKTVRDSPFVIVPKWTKE